MKVWQAIWRWRGSALRTLIVLGGVATAFVTVWARRAGDWQTARAGAVASLIFVVLMVVFVVPPLSRSARVEAARLDLPFQVTAGGLIFVGLFLVVAFAAWNTGNNLLFLVFSVLASALFVAWTAARASLRDLVVSARFPDHIFAGEAAPVIVTLHNTKRLLPSFSILVEARSREDDVRKPRRFLRTKPRYAKRVLAYFMYVPRRARAEQRVEQTFAARGHVLITGFELSTRFPFGFFRLRRRLRARDVDLVIYPKPQPASDELHLLPMSAGQTASARRGAGHDLYSLRDYQPHDDVRHIDWKATARTSRLVVREFTAEGERRVHVLFDTRAPVAAKADEGDAQTGVTSSGGDFPARFERGVTLAASLVAHFVDERAEVRLTLGAEVGEYGTGREHLYASLRRLALVKPVADAPADEPPTDFWERVVAPARNASPHYVILLTTAAPGSIPTHVWRNSHVIYL
jgi:uncharacterized protein (DUF58 family)